MPQIYKWCKEGLDAGKHVVRLKIGDPFVFGRGGEEVLKFREFGVEPKVIPVSIVTKNNRVNVEYDKDILLTLIFLNRVYLQHSLLRCWLRYQ